MTKYFNKFKKPCFWPIIFSQFLGQNFFLSENPALLRTTSCGFQAPCQNLEKTNYAIPRKRPGRRKDDRRTDRPYFIGPFRLQPGFQKKRCGNIQRRVQNPVEHLKWCFL